MTAFSEAETRTQAQCEDCPELAPEADRSAARNHAVSRGHLVRFVVEKISTYVGVRKPPPSDKPTVEQRFGEAVRARRLADGWSQQRLSDELRKAGVELHQSGVSRLEMGTRGTGLNEAQAIADLLGLDRSDWQS